MKLLAICIDYRRVCFRLYIDGKEVVASRGILGNLHFNEELAGRCSTKRLTLHPVRKSSLIVRRTDPGAEIERNGLDLRCIRPIELDLQPDEISWLPEFCDLLGRDGGLRLGYEAEPKLVYQLPVIHKLPEDNVRLGFLEADQYERLLEELPANLTALFVCAYHTGARKNEMRRIEWPQVDFAARLIRLSGGQTKNKRPRTLPIYGDMKRWLERQRET